MKNNDPLTWVCRTNSNHLGFESSVKEKDHQTQVQNFAFHTLFESSVKEKDHQTNVDSELGGLWFESSVKEKDHQTSEGAGGVTQCLRAV